MLFLVVVTLCVIRGSEPKKSLINGNYRYYDMSWFKRGKAQRWNFVSRGLEPTDLA